MTQVYKIVDHRYDDAIIGTGSVTALIKAMCSVEPDRVLDRQSAPRNVDRHPSLADPIKAKPFNQVSHVSLGRRVRACEEQHAPAAGGAGNFDQFTATGTRSWAAASSLVPAWMGPPISATRSTRLSDPYCWIERLP